MPSSREAAEPDPRHGHLRVQLVGVITPDGRTVYVTNLGSNTVTPISTATNKAGHAIRTGKTPVAIAITP